MAISKDFIVKNGVVVLGKDSAQSTSTSTGALVVNGGVGISGQLNVGGTTSTIAGSLSVGTTAALPAWKLYVLGGAYFSGEFSADPSGSNINLGINQTTGNWTAGGTRQTGTITIGRSTLTQTLSVANGAIGPGITKTVNIGTNGLSGSTTIINIGTTASGSTSSISLSGVTNIINTTSATSTITGALIVGGGAGVGKDLYVGGVVYSNGLPLIPSKIQETTATSGQTTFTVNGGYTTGTVQIFANGIALGQDDFTANDGTSVVLTDSRLAGDVIRIVSGGIMTQPVVGIPTGGNTGQVLTKTSSTNYEAAWSDPASGSQGYISLSTRRLYPLGFFPTFNTATSLPASSLVLFYPIIILENTTFVRIGTRITSRTGGNMYIALYDNNAGVPGNRLETSAAITTLGAVETTINRALTAGVYWLAFGASSPNNVAVSVMTGVGDAVVGYMGAGTVIDQFAYPIYRIDGVGVPPSTGASATVSSANISPIQYPAVWLRSAV